MDELSSIKVKPEDVAILTNLIALAGAAIQKTAPLLAGGLMVYMAYRANKKTVEPK